MHLRKKILKYYIYNVYLPYLKRVVYFSSDCHFKSENLKRCLVDECIFWNDKRSILRDKCPKTDCEYKNEYQ